MQIDDRSQWQLQGDIFTDGSCTRRYNSEFNRAAWAAVQVDRTGATQAILQGIVPRTLPQTPQSAEYFAAAAATELTSDRARIHIDCKGVVEALTKGKEQEKEEEYDNDRDIRGKASKARGQPIGVQ